MTHNSSASSSKCSTNGRSKSSSKVAETETKYGSSKSEKNHSHNTDNFSNHISGNIAEKEGHRRNTTTNATSNIANAYNKVNKDVQHKTCE